MEPERVVVIGASAGGVEALRELVARLPADFAAPVLVVVHVPSSTPSALPKLLSRFGPLPAEHAYEGARLVPGRILVAPPDRHVVVYDDDRVGLRQGPKENRQRPAIDPLFISAARRFGPATVAVILSGALDDGAVGAAAVAAQDGIVLVQDPDDAQVSAMPRAALKAVRRAVAAPVSELAASLLDIVRRHVADGDQQADADTVLEDRMAQSERVELQPTSSPVGIGCPECQGGMFESAAGGALQYVCHVGHSWSPQTLLDAQEHSVEAALYNAASKLREVACVHRRLAEAAEGGDAGDRERHLDAAERAERNCRRIVEEMLVGADEGIPARGRRDADVR